MNRIPSPALPTGCWPYRRQGRHRLPGRAKKGEWVGKSGARRDHRAAAAGRVACRDAAARCGCWWSAAAWARRRSTMMPEGAGADCPEPSVRVVTHQAGRGRRRPGGLSGCRRRTANCCLHRRHGGALRLDADLVICRAGAHGVAELAAAASAAGARFPTRWMTTRPAMPVFSPMPGGGADAAN